MPVHINEVRSTVHAFDATALLDEEVMRTIVARVAQEMMRREGERTSRAHDTAFQDQRRETG